MTADGTTGILTVSEYAQFARAEPAGDDLDHFQRELRTSAILLFGGLSGLFLFRLPSRPGASFDLFRLR